MDKQELIESLKKMGIDSENCYPKTSFRHEDEVVVGLYEREMKNTFYFYNKYDKSIYRFNKQPDTIYPIDTDTDKLLIPLRECESIWVDEPYKEPVDTPFRDVTLRQYACIHLKIADSGLPWLDTLINKSTNK